MSLRDRLNSNLKQNVKITTETSETFVNLDAQEAASEVLNVRGKSNSLGVIDTMLHDDDLNSIYVNGAKNIFIERKGKVHKSSSSFRDNVHLENLIKKAALAAGLRINAQTPYVKFNCDLGVNIAAALPPVTSNPTLFVKCYKDKFADFKTLQEIGAMSKEMALALEILVTIKCNIIIAGEKNTLKTTLLSALAKKLPAMNRGVVVDYQHEFKIDSPNYSNFDFSDVAAEKTRIEILESIINSDPDKLIVNDCSESTLSYLAKKAMDGYRGFIVTICAATKKEAMEKLTISILKNNPALNYETARALAYKAIELIIFVDRTENGKRRIQEVSQIDIDLENNCSMQDVFYINDVGEHQSTGFNPAFFEAIKLNSLPISLNIFEPDYIHTYHKSFESDIKKTPNLDILKKFKKELNPEALLEGDELRQEVEKHKNQQVRLKAQKKLEELKNNIIQENIAQITEDNDDAPSDII